MKEQGILRLQFKRVGGSCEPMLLLNTNLS